MIEMYQALIITKWKLVRINEEKAQRLIDKLSQWKTIESERVEGAE